MKRGVKKQNKINIKSLRRNYDKRVARSLKDMKKHFSDSEEVKKILKKRNPVIYTVFRKNLELDAMIALTVINPGTTGREYYFTKGHKHKKPLPEIYVLIKGQGKLILQNRKSRVISLKKGKQIIISGKFAHRLVNVGKKKLEVVSIYSKKAGMGYRVNFKKRLLKK